ncbi:hypothetical protein JCM19237_1098 [Photobacterium aphoticum]|uniref:DUF7021 domain-containing protein n=1 Tax=Photobacterium aphoticum TaxID=754436 RepID=A0A090QND3_9GAMM|nr:hypothetical protein JCM19237_1098 [Photobacterium aphoticum]
MQISLKPWRYKGDADFKKTEMVISKIVEHEEIEKLRELLAENKAYQFKVKVSDYLFSTYDNALLLDVIGEVTDPILVELADEVSREVTYDDPA